MRYARPNSVTSRNIAMVCVGTVCCVYGHYGMYISLVLKQSYSGVGAKVTEQ